MRSSFLLNIAIVTVGLLLPLQAGDILVYKGSRRSKQTVESGSPPNASLYFIVDLETREVRRIEYWTTRDFRRQFVLPGTVDITRATASNGRRVSLLGNSSAIQLSPVSFSHQYLSLRGYDVSVQIETQPAVRTVLRPKTLTGIYSTLIGAGAADLGFFTDTTFNLTLNAALTQDANDNDRTLSQVEDLIQQRLTEQGYLESVE